MHTQAKNNIEKAYLHLKKWRSHFFLSEMSEKVYSNTTAIVIEHYIPQ